MCCKVYEYEDENGFSLYLNANERADSDLVLNLYINWYNKHFAPEENLPEVHFEDFKFIKTFCPIDFFDESSEIVRYKGVVNA